MSNKNKMTINEIAKLAQTSKTTVSFYLNGKTHKMAQSTQDRIAKVIEETGYKPSIVARSLNAKSIKLIGVLIGDITNSFSNQIVKGIEEIASMNGYQILVGNTNYNKEEETSYVERMLSLGVDGFIVQPSSNFKEYAKIIEEKKKALVFFDSKIYDHKSNWVKTNNYESTYETITQCVDKGYERFVIIMAKPSLLSTRIERSSGFIDALANRDLPYESLIIEEKNIDEKEIVDFIGKVNKDTKTLVFVPNCWALPDVFTAIKRNIKNLDNIGIVGFDNTEWTTLTSPTITTIVQPAFEEGKQAAKILIDQIEDKNMEETQQVLDCVTVWNESTQL